MASFVTARGSQVGPATRPVSIPDDLDDGRPRVTSGRVELPLHVAWSGTPRRYDLDVPRDGLLLYELVLAEGGDDDVRTFIDVNTVVASWDELVLPRHVRRAWADWLREHRGLSLSC